MTCKHKNLETIRDIGSDLWENGEEQQHIERCTDCGQWRFFAEGWVYTKTGSKSFQHRGTWQENDGWLESQFLI